MQFHKRQQMGERQYWNREWLEINPLAQNVSRKININKTIPGHTKIKSHGNKDKKKKDNQSIQRGGTNLLKEKTIRLSFSTALMEAQN